MQRRYQLLCPIARTLDAVGDRWALLVLRDLHAGPARFQELEKGLGIATNLLTARLRDLVADGLVRHRDDRAYELTDLGRRTDRLLWEMARFGATLPPDESIREPGNLRTVALSLRMLLAGATDRPALEAELRVDGTSFTIHSSPESVEVDYGPPGRPVDVIIETDYEALIAVGDGLLTLEEFADSHARVVHGTERASDFAALMASALAANA